MNNKFIMLNFRRNVHNMIFLSVFLILFIFCGAEGIANGLVVWYYSGTGDSLEMTIDGDGLFILKDTNNNVYYSRFGEFHKDDEEYLVSSSGFRLQGYTITSEGFYSAGLEDIQLSGEDINDLEVSSHGITGNKDPRQDRLRDHSG